jgi:hypothetical protein
MKIKTSILSGSGISSTPDVILLELHSGISSTVDVKVP